MSGANPQFRLRLSNHLLICVESEARKQKRSNSATIELIVRKYIKELDYAAPWPIDDDQGLDYFKLRFEGDIFKEIKAAAARKNTSLQNVILAALLKHFGSRAGRVNSAPTMTLAGLILDIENSAEMEEENRIAEAILGRYPAYCCAKAINYGSLTAAKDVVVNLLPCAVWQVRCKGYHSAVATVWPADQSEVSKNSYTAEHDDPATALVLATLKAVHALTLTAIQETADGG